ncbi:hypothetical protein A249_11827, partial [Pseudomonas syringae pv. actinidiae ICMP 18804]
QMEIYLKNTQGLEYKLVPAEPSDKHGTPAGQTTLQPVNTKVAPATKDAPEPPELRLD